MANNAKHPQVNLLLTRPLAGSNAFLADLPPAMRTNITPIVSPLIEIVGLATDFGDFGQVIFTSAHGVQYGPDGNGNVAYCVGAMTTQAALARGWRAIQAGGTAQQLVQNLIKRDLKDPLTHLCGVYTRGDIAERLTASGMTTTRVTVYDQQLRPLTQKATEVLASNFPLLLPLFSPRTAKSFSEQHKGHAPVHIIALSDEVAEQVRGPKWQSLIVSNRPTRGSMIASIQKILSGMTLG